VRYCCVSKRWRTLIPGERKKDLILKVKEKKNKACVHTMAWPFTSLKKGILRAKEVELWKLKYYTMQKYNLQKFL
jgi:hypothetical protein